MENSSAQDCGIILQEEEGEGKITTTTTTNKFAFKFPYLPTKNESSHQ